MLDHLQRAVVDLGVKAVISVDSMSSALVDGHPANIWSVLVVGRTNRAYAVAFLLSGEASYITGQSRVVDGGLLTLR